MKKFAALLFVLLAFPSILEAQPVINPTTAQFTSSVDHDVVMNGTNLVTSYELRVFQQSQPAPVRTLNLNKPTPDATSTITVNISTLVASLTVGEYYATVVAKGPGGDTVSAPSNPFTVAVRAPAAPTNLLITKSGQ